MYRSGSVLEAHLFPVPRTSRVTRSPLATDSTSELDTPAWVAQPEQTSTKTTQARLARHTISLHDQIAALPQRLPRSALSRMPRCAFPAGARRAGRRVLRAGRVERRAPAAVVVLSQLEVVALAMHAHRDATDAGPRVEPRPQRPERAIVRRHGQGCESERGDEQVPAVVGHRGGRGGWHGHAPLRRWPHAGGPAEAAWRDRHVPSLALLHRLALLARRAPDVGAGWQVERRDQPVTVASTDRERHTRGRHREVRLDVLVPRPLADVAIRREQHP